MRVKCFADNAAGTVAGQLCGMVNANAESIDTQITDISLRMKKVSKTGLTARLNWSDAAGKAQSTGDLRISVKDGALNPSILSRFAGELVKGVK